MGCPVVFGQGKSYNATIFSRGLYVIRRHAAKPSVIRDYAVYFGVHIVEWSLWGGDIRCWRRLGSGGRHCSPDILTSESQMLICWYWRLDM
eukprot:1345484-Amorphochlora_amoeboformis.AAC.2